MIPPRRAAKAVNGLIVEPAGSASSKTKREFTIARTLPVCGSITKTAPSLDPRAAVAARCSLASTSSVALTRINGGAATPGDGEQEPNSSAPDGRQRISQALQPRPRLEKNGA